MLTPSIYQSPGFTGVSSPILPSNLSSSPVSPILTGSQVQNPIIGSGGVSQSLIPNQWSGRIMLPSNPILPGATTSPMITPMLMPSPLPQPGSVGLTSPNMKTSQGPGPVPVLGEVRYNFIKENSGLTEGQEKYCRCLLRVENSGRAYSPYGVCTKNDPSSQVHSCSQYYDFGAMDIDMMTAYMSLHKLSTEGIQTREQALQAIAQWKAGRGESF
jgi:hypothetical protein